MASRKQDEEPDAERDAAFDQLQFADEFARRAPSMPRMAGRMLGLLVICDESSLSSRDLMERLGASSASISNMGRLLIRLGYVERTVSLDTRRDIFRVRSDAWTNIFRNRQERTEEYVAFLEEAMAARMSTGSPSVERIADVRDYHAFVLSELPQTIARYEKWRAEQHALRERGAVRDEG